MTAHQSLLMTRERSRQTARTEQLLSNISRAADALEQARGNVYRATRQTALLLEAEARGAARDRQETQ